MTVHLVTFSDSQMSRSRELCVESAKRNGVGLTHQFAPSDVESLLTKHGIDPSARGCGYWAFKPAIILAMMDQIGITRAYFNLDNPDYLVYSDAGVEFINSVSHIIDRMDQDIFLFGNNWEHAHWCKRDVIDAVWWEGANPDFHDGAPPWEIFGKQCQASVIFFRVSDYSRRFVKEWLDWCLFEGGRLIDDSPSRSPNHPEFQEHRHDQAILTTLAYREGVKLHWWGARYCMDRPDGGFVYPKLPEYAADYYEPFVHHHRKRNHEWSNAA